MTLVANNSRPARGTSSGRQALEASNSFRDSQCGRSLAAGPCRARRQGRRERDRLGAARRLRAAGRGNAEGAGSSPPRKEPGRGLGRSLAPSDDPGRFSSQTSRGPTDPEDTLSPVRGQASCLAGPDPTEKRIAPHAAPPFARRSGASPPIWVPPLRCPRRASPPAQDLPQQPHRFHSRGAPVAEFVGDGLDAPGPGHRDVAALRAYVQSHHRHGRLAVLLRPGLGPSPPPLLSALPRAVPRGPTAPVSLGRPGCQGTVAVCREVTREQAVPSVHGSLRSSGDCLDVQPLSPRSAPNHRPKRGGPSSSALCIALIRTFQNLRHLLTGASAGPSTCHFRFLLLEPSLPNGGLVPEGDGRRCHGGSSAALALLAQPARPRAHARPP